MGKIKKFISCRLPKGSLWQALKKTKKQIRENPEDRVFKKIYRLNLKCYFHFGKNYHLMSYDESENVPKYLFHVTSKENFEEIMKSGLKNPKTGIVFLTDSVKYLRHFFNEKKDPVLLCVDAEKMFSEKYRFYQNSDYFWMWISEEIPPKFLCQGDFEKYRDYMI